MENPSLGSIQAEPRTDRSCVSLAGRPPRWPCAAFPHSASPTKHRTRSTNEKVKIPQSLWPVPPKLFSRPIPAAARPLDLGGGGGGGP